ncbi:hypothetical protein [Serratia sp. DD3]|uniref:hypothetical protein n=1 Tax=Serratia sp. DD3 TaxID=1410619 RepID=UPI0004D45123|nr:hypothetical protein [Serratia sp. DD3]KEY58918.1 hypothetical protein SRDD_21140 [Serratia sp. DD3]
MAIALTTQITEQTLNIIQSFKAERIPLSEAEDFVSNLLEKAIVDIEANPLQYPIDQTALLLGVRLHRWLDPTGKYICLFRYLPATDEVILDIFANTKQDWLSLLYLVQISRP